PRAHGRAAWGPGTPAPRALCPCRRPPPRRAWRASGRSGGLNGASADGLTVGVRGAMISGCLKVRPGAGRRQLTNALPPSHVPTMRTLPLFLAFLALPLAMPVMAQAPAQQPALTADDYARAERFLSAGTTPLVDGTATRITWLRDGRLFYRAVT